MRKAGWALGAIIAVISAATGAAQASTGCSLVQNLGYLNLDQIPADTYGEINTPIPGVQFSAGDTLHIHATLRHESDIVHVTFDGMALFTRNGVGEHNVDLVVTTDQSMRDYPWSVDIYNFNAGSASVIITCTPVGEEGPEPEPEDNEDSAVLDTIATNVGGQSAQASAGMMGNLSRAGFAAASSDDGTAVLTALDVGQATAAVKVDFATLWAGLNARGVVPGSTGWLGGQAMGAAGINFELSEGMIAGLFATVEGGAYADVDAGHALDVRGAGIGANALFELGDGWNIQGLVAYSLIAYSLDASGVTGEFDAQRLVADLSINGSVPVGDGIVFEPRAGVFLLREVQAAYTDSASVDHDEAMLQTYRAEAGGRLIFAVPGMSGTHVYTGAYGRYSDSGGASGMLTAGASVDLGTAALGLELSLDNIGSTQPMGYGVTGRLAAEF